METNTENVVAESYHSRVLKVMVHVQENLDQPLSLEHLAKIAHFSPFHFHRVFSALVGESWMSHVRRLRFERAAHQLALTDRRILDIALAASYENPESFTCAFQNHFGITPTGFREQNRAAPVVGPTMPLRDQANGRAAGKWPDVRQEILQPIQVAFVRHIGPYRNAASAWQELGSWAAVNDLRPKTSWGVAYDDPELTPEDCLRYDACFEISGPMQPQGRIGAQTLAGGEYAILTHFGAYENLGATFDALYGKWLPASGREPRDDPPLLRYLTAMHGIPSDQLKTDVCIPLESLPDQARSSMTRVDEE